MPSEPRPWVARLASGAVIAAAAVAVRALAAGLIAWKPPFPPHYFNDAALFDTAGWQAAQAMLGAGPWPEFDVSRRGFQTFIGLVYLAFGRHPIVVQLLFCLLGGLAAWLLVRIGRELSDENGAAAAGWLFALWPSAVFYGGQLMKDPAVIPCLWLGLAGLVCRGRTWLRAGAAGAVLATLVRPSAGAPLLALFALRGLLTLPRRWAVALILGVALAVPGGYHAREGWLPTEFQDASRFPLELSRWRYFRFAGEVKNGGRIPESRLFEGRWMRSWKDLAVFAPEAAFHAALMPLPGLYPMEGKRGRQAAAAENVGWLVFAVLAAFGLWRSRGRLDRRWAVLGVFAAATLAGSALFDLDLGAMARHKLQYLPLLFLAAPLAFRTARGDYFGRMNSVFPSHATLPPCRSPKTSSSVATSGSPSLSS
ncbi:MAG: hypothetical protein HYZ75_10625 [Elusimicrobia bacterium]|nr:hypothetical protein [Elusimicrobiota bacterium]